MALEIVNIISLFAIFIFLLIIFRKVRKIHLWTYQIGNDLEKKTDNVISQIESLMGLYKDLQLNKSIPKTRGWAGSPDFLLNIARLAQKNKPAVVVECSSGASTVILAQALKLNGGGHVYSLDHEPFYGEKTREELKRHGLNDWATVIDAPLVDYEIDGKKWKWYSLHGFELDITIDMLVIDGPPVHINELSRYPALPIFYEKIKSYGVVVLDDANRDSEKKIVEIWKKNFKFNDTCAGFCEKGIFFIQK